MTSVCPSMNEKVQNCGFHSSAMFVQCSCDTLAQNHCSPTCVNGSEPNSYLKWTIDLYNEYKVNNTPALAAPDWSDSWTDYNHASRAAYLALFPLKWNLQPNQTQLTNGTSALGNKTVSSKLETGGICPTVPQTLGSFAIMNTVVFMDQ